MQIPQWAKAGDDTFWRRNYELSTMAEKTCEQAIEDKLQRWLKDLELTDGPAAADDTDP